MNSAVTHPSSPTASLLGSHFLTTKEAARYLGLAHRTLEDWRMRGTGPVFRKFSRKVMYARVDLDAFANECVCTNTGQGKSG